MGRRPEDPIEDACRRWGTTRRHQLGWGTFGYGTIYEAAEQLGPLQSMLGRLREDRNAFGERSGKVVQLWPECYTGDVLQVHRAWNVMDRAWREPFDVHFTLPYDDGVNAWRLTARQKADAIGMPLPTYWKVIALAKTFVQGFLAQNDSKSTEVVYTGSAQ